jgi:hypothetical protein
LLLDSLLAIVMRDSADFFSLSLSGSAISSRIRRGIAPFIAF